MLVSSSSKYSIQHCVYGRGASVVCGSTLLPSIDHINQLPSVSAACKYPPRVSCCWGNIITIRTQEIWRHCHCCCHWGGFCVERGEEVITLIISSICHHTTPPLDTARDRTHCVSGHWRFCLIRHGYMATISNIVCT